VQRVIEAHLPPGHLAQIALVERIERQTLAQIIEQCTIESDEDDVEEEDQDVTEDEIEDLEDEDPKAE
jgi:hypothetical protein